jgi:hypothetical protein
MSLLNINDSIMKFFLSILVLFTFPSSVKIITLPDFYCGKGAIFDKTSHFPSKNNDYFEAITPTIEQIKRSETILFNDYYNYEINICKFFNSDTTFLKAKYKKPENVKKRYRKYYRQYAGYVNIDKDTIIFMNLMNFTNKKRANDKFEYWDKSILYGFGDWYLNNEELFYINLTNKMIEINVER